METRLPTETRSASCQSGATTATSVSSVRFLGVHLTSDLTWSFHTNKVVRSARQHLFFLRRLRKFGLPPDILTNFHRCTIEHHREHPHGLHHCLVPALAPVRAVSELMRSRCLRKIQKTQLDCSHPAHGLFTLLPSGRRYRSIQARTNRLMNSFYPQAIRFLNKLNEVECLDGWCKVNDLVLNTSKTKEIVVDFRRTKKSDHLPLHISGAEVERVEKVKFLGVHITNHLTWSPNTSYLCMRAQQRLCFPRKLKQAQLPQKLLVSFYRSTIESILSHCMIVWYSSCTVSERKDLHRVVKVAGRIIGTDLPSLDSVHTSRLKKKASSISRDATHPGHCLFDLLPSGKRYRAIRTKTNRLRNSFFPRAVVSTTPPQHLTD
ncbi:hypothetical protein NFI96_024236 [Prochilodus magdalenae]|nr:hypothetical protein NFI96_024236 [Prochilodus magdalenae]